MPDHWITKKIFIWCNTLNVKNWNYMVKSSLTSIDKLLYVDIENIIDKECFQNDLRESRELLNEINRVNVKRGKINSIHIIHSNVILRVNCMYIW